MKSMPSKDDKIKYLGLSAAVNRGWFPGGLLEKLPFACNISERVLQLFVSQ
jgi:hypothetical protein